jgi:hypothetical protein
VPLGRGELLLVRRDAAAHAALVATLKEDPLLLVDKRVISHADLELAGLQQ